MSTYRELQDQISKLQREAEALLKAERSQAIVNITEQMALFGITAKDLMGKEKSRKSNKRSDGALYKDPDSDKTWSGRGRQPKWIKGSKEDYAIK